MLHTGPFAKIYYSSQFAPLIIFFLMFLSIVKNKKLHHFVRFNCMQASAGLTCWTAWFAVLHRTCIRLDIAPFMLQFPPRQHGACCMQRTGGDARSHVMLLHFLNAYSGVVSCIQQKTHGAQSMR